MLIGYMRVSTPDRSLDLQRDALVAAGVAEDRVYRDVCSGKAADRPGLARSLDVAREGDAIVAWKLDRLGRSLPHVVGLVGDLAKRGVGLKVLTGDVDTTTATGRLVFGIFATLAEAAARPDPRAHHGGARRRPRPGAPRRAPAGDDAPEAPRGDGADGRS